MFFFLFIYKILYKWKNLYYNIYENKRGGYHIMNSPEQETMLEKDLAETERRYLLLAESADKLEAGFETLLELVSAMPMCVDEYGPNSFAKYASVFELFKRLVSCLEEYECKVSVPAVYTETFKKLLSC